MKYKHIIFLCILSFALTLMTFSSKRYVEQQRVDQNLSPYVSAFVEGRGWPFAYFVDDPTRENFGTIGSEDKLFLDSFIFDWIFILILCSLVFGIFNLVKRLIAKININMST